MATEKRLIDANEFEEAHCFGCPYRLEGSCTKDDPICATIEDLRDFPTVDAVEVVHGLWVDKEEKLWNLEKPVVTGWECSKCGVWGHYTYNYCPNCGAHMRDGDGNGT